MQPIDIKYLLAKKGLTQTDIARQCQVTVPAVNKVIAGDRTSHRIATCIAEHLGNPVDAIWPGRYHRNLRRAA